MTLDIGILFEYLAEKHQVSKNEVIHRFNVVIEKLLFEGKEKNGN